MSRTRKPQTPHRRRQRGLREPNVTIGIICQGKVTEVDYFKRLKEVCGWKQVRIDRGSAGKSPQGLLDYARAKVQRGEGWDVIFIVVDVDNDSAQSLRKVCQACMKASQARKGTVYHLVVTDPAIELWLCWHLEKRKTHQELGQLQAFLANKSMLVTSQGQSRKGAKNISTSFPVGDYRMAMNNAVEIGLNEVGQNPSSSVGAMIREIIRINEENSQ